MTPRVRRFYLVAIWMPIVLPSIIWAGFAARGGGTFVGFGADLGGILVASVLFAGAPYAIAALCASWWVMRRARTERDIRRLMLCAPLVVAPVAILWWIVVFGIKEGAVSGLIYAGWFTLYLLPIGYLYVLGTVVARVVARIVGYVPAADVTAS